MSDSCKTVSNVDTYSLWIPMNYLVWTRWLSVFIYRGWVTLVEIHRRCGPWRGAVGGKPVIDRVISVPLSGLGEFFLTRSHPRVSSRPQLTADCVCQGASNKFPVPWTGFQMKCVREQCMQTRREGLHSAENNTFVYMHKHRTANERERLPSLAH